MLIRKWFQKMQLLEFFRYRTLMSIKWLEFSLRWKIGKTVLNTSFYTMRNRWPTYKWIRILWTWRKKTTLLTILCLVRRVLQIFGSCIGNHFQDFGICLELEKRIGSFHNKDRKISYKELSVRAKWIERFMFGSGRDHRHFEMNGKRIYFH